ncbi:uncharacterized protein VTP21DRAFT_6754 [Calcarisporiella thermophila]|uniref:uncharacterized protein n=1 Tax=Calcarisporiella thermophila TaxID=911321 RepID=UPI00374223CF
MSLLSWELCFYRGVKLFGESKNESGASPTNSAGIVAGIKPEASLPVKLRKKMKAISLLFLIAAVIISAASTIEAARCVCYKGVIWTECQGTCGETNYCDYGPYDGWKCHEFQDLKHKAPKPTKKRIESN